MEEFPPVTSRRNRRQGHCIFLALDVATEHCRWVLKSMPSFLPIFLLVTWLSQPYCLCNVNYVWVLFVFRSLEAFGQGPPVDESLLLVFVISNNTCKHYVVSAHLSLQGKETWLFHPRASAIWFGTYSAQKVQRLHIFY